MPDLIHLRKEHNTVNTAYIRCLGRCHRIRSINSVFLLSREEDKSMYIHIRTIILTLLVSVSGNALANNDLAITGIHAFGTSLSDEGNAFIACGGQSVPPYDNLTSFLNAAPGDAPYARGGHHFSNGSTWVEPLAKSLGVNNSALPVRQNPVGTNYAQAGTTAIPEGPLGPLPCRISFAEQIEAALGGLGQLAAVERRAA